MSLREKELHRALMRSETREAFVDHYRTGLAHWERRLAELQGAGAGLESIERPGFDARYEALRAGVDEVRDGLESLTEARHAEDEGAWDALRGKAERAWERVKSAGEALTDALDRGSRR